MYTPGSSMRAPGPWQQRVQHRRPAHEPATLSHTRPGGIRASPVLQRAGELAAQRVHSYKEYTVSTKSLGKHRKKHARRSKIEPLEKTQRSAVADSTWVQDPSSGEQRQTRLSRFRTLMLDSSYRPIAVVNWQRAVSMDWMRKVDVLEYWPGVSVASARAKFEVPAVMRVRFYVQRPKRLTASVSRRNILLRDHFTCQYCGSRENLTIDHVVPASKGGEFSWSNCVTACRDCNMKKGSKTLAQIGWVPMKPPREPTPHELAPLRLMPASSFDDLEPWKNYLMPWIKKSRASLDSGRLSS